jgi:SdrD B-like protein
MRGSLVVLALAISPFVATPSRAQDPSSPGNGSRPMCTKDPGNPSSTGEANRTKKCPPVATGKVTISGIVFFDQPPYDGWYDPENENGIAGWTVVLTGPTGQLTYNTATDPNNPGAFMFSGLPSGATYTLCVQPTAGWTQTAPMAGATCTSTVGNTWGYTIVVPALASDTTISNQNFGFYAN